MIGDFLFDHFGKILIVFSIIMISGTSYVVYQDYKKPTFQLKKEEWTCTESHQQMTTTYIYVNKIIIPQTTLHTICDNYRRIK